mmetsp:Transcript_134723/g.430421  ORF Transcript_134723/g.430421 Transcript_134723/m.430421 type:complete len:472 (-) Transcript_134723:4116-5531(-)
MVAETDEKSTKRLKSSFSVAPCKCHAPAALGSQTLARLWLFISASGHLSRTPAAWMMPLGAPKVSVASVMSCPTAACEATSHLRMWTSVVGTASNHRNCASKPCPAGTLPVLLVSITQLAPNSASCLADTKPKPPRPPVTICKPAASTFLSIIASWRCNAEAVAGASVMVGTQRPCTGKWATSTSDSAAANSSATNFDAASGLASTGTSTALIVVRGISMRAERTRPQSVEPASNFGREASCAPFVTTTNNFGVCDACMAPCRNASNSWRRAPGNSVSPSSAACMKIAACALLLLRAAATSAALVPASWVAPLMSVRNFSAVAPLPTTRQSASKAVTGTSGAATQASSKSTFSNHSCQGFVERLKVCVGRSGSWSPGVSVASRMAWPLVPLKPKEETPERSTGAFHSMRESGMSTSKPERSMLGFNFSSERFGGIMACLNVKMTLQTPATPAEPSKWPMFDLAAAKVKGRA